MICEQVFRLKKNGEPYCDCYCRNPELIENYDKAIADTTQTWQVHHRKEEFYSQKELIEKGEYYDVSPEELIFLTKSEHHKIDSRCKRISESHKGLQAGSKNPMFGHHYSDEHKRKMSEAMKNRKDLSKKVLCIETGEVFESTRDAQRKTGIYCSGISMVCNGKLKTAGGFHWKFCLEE